MAMGRRRGRQRPLWIGAQDLAKSPGHPFYEKLNRLFGEHGFDGFVEEQCQGFYAKKMGRPSLAPGIYFRSLMIGYFEGIESERGIAWRVADSIGLREFLGFGLTDETPDHSTISRTRRLIDVESHEAVFGWILEVLTKAGLVKGKTLGVDATTLEANAAMRSIVRRDSGESYEEFLTALAKASGIETPTREDLARLDRSRKKKGSNQEWTHPYDPDARITRMKDGRTHLAHKMEHAVDMETGAVLAVTIQPADRGDCQSLEHTIDETCMVFEDLLDDAGAAAQLSSQILAEVVADKGYHSNDVLVRLQQQGFRTYVSEPKRGRRRWHGKEEERDAVHANRRRVRGQRGRRLLRRRGEVLERPFAHALETGSMRRVFLRGAKNIRKRVLVHVAGLNLGLLMRTLYGVGSPRGLQTRLGAFFDLHKRLHRCLLTLSDHLTPRSATQLAAGRLRSLIDSVRSSGLSWAIRFQKLQKLTFSTGC
jgi:transposase